MPAVANEALATWERHLDYLTPQLIILGLVCDRMPVDQKNSMARELLSLLDNRPEEFQPSPVAPPGPNFTRSNAFLSADDAMPDLGRFITVESFLIFNILGTSSDVLRTWLSAPADTWSFDPNSPNFYDGFAHLHLFALNCHWTNDAAERSVLKKLNCLFYQKKTFRLIAVLKERVPTTHGEDTLQQIVTVTTDERARVRRGKGNHFNKDALQNMLRK